jgi:hypothetical protein
MSSLIKKYDEKLLEDALEYGWIVISNVSEGDWTKQSVEWQEAAARFRSYYHSSLDRRDA